MKLKKHWCTHTHLSRRCGRADADTAGVQHNATCALWLWRNIHTTFKKIPPSSVHYLINSLFEIHNLRWIHSLFHLFSVEKIKIIRTKFFFSSVNDKDFMAAPLNLFISTLNSFSRVFINLFNPSIGKKVVFFSLSIRNLFGHCWSKKKENNSF